MIFEYGVDGKYVDVTDLVNKHFSSEDEYFIPSSDNRRSIIFGDHIFGVPKNIRVTDDSGSFVFDNEEPILIKKDGVIPFPVKKRIDEIHSSLNFQGGSLKEEYPEQILSAVFVKPDDVVLELGANIGRNTLLISSLLSESSNLVAVETIPETAKILEINRDKNNLNFHIENSAISKSKIIQLGWDSFVVKNDFPTPKNFIEVKTITFSELLEKYNLNFTCLVCDCEGALYNILLEEENFLNTFNTIIVENDYDSINKKNKVDEIFKKNGFNCILKRELNFRGEYRDDFYAVWKRNYFFNF